MNILAIRPDVLGDSLVTFPLLVALRAKYSNPHITYVGYSGAMPLAKAWGIADEVYNNDAAWAELFNVAGIRQTEVRDVLERTDLAIGWAYDSSFIRQNLQSAGIKEITIVPFFLGKLKQNEDEHLHIVEYYAKWIGVPAIKPEHILLPYTGRDEFCSYVPPIALQLSCRINDPWPVVSFAALIHELGRLQYPVLVLAGPSDGPLVAELLAKVRRHNLLLLRASMVTVLENAPLLEVARRLKQCGCYVGHNTGPSHLAGLLSIPTLALYGDSNAELWHPLGPYVQVIQEASLSLKRLSVQKVLENILRLYNSHHKSYSQEMRA